MCSSDLVASASDSGFFDSSAKVTRFRCPMLTDKTVSKRIRDRDLSKVVINMLDDSSINVRLEPFLSNEVPSYIME